MDHLEYKPDLERYRSTGERPLLYYKHKQTILCPYANKLPLVNKLTGQMTLEATPCSELCPHFTVIETLNDTQTDEIKFIDIALTCGAGTKNIRLAIDQEKSNKIATI